MTFRTQDVCHIFRRARYTALHLSCQWMSGLRSGSGCQVPTLGGVDGGPRPTCGLAQSKGNSQPKSTVGRVISGSKRESQAPTPSGLATWNTGSTNIFKAQTSPGQEEGPSGSHPHPDSAGLPCLWAQPAPLKVVHIASPGIGGGVQGVQGKQASC